MSIITLCLVGLVAVEHIYILIIEMFYWNKPYGRRMFGLKEGFANESKVLAANQGLYNGFLAVGLFWGMFHPNEAFGTQIQTFFLGCVLVAAIYGGLSAKKSIIITQGLPALLAMLSVILL
ncbi:DUF1304 domain-containing protein [Marinicellulosiphila megalodicopiae]|uniref:DUF1304 domain-containing protein n=1 Tax=Marinicellulosiphila megalodicopiae TaxID=2724896 RepID=UPI003BAEFC2D